MNGDITFGDHFEEEAVAHAWEFSPSPRSESDHGAEWRVVAPTFSGFVPRLGL